MFRMHWAISLMRIVSMVEDFVYCMLTISDHLMYQLADLTT